MTAIKFSFLALFLTLSLTAFSQTKISWDVLADLTYEAKWLEEYQMEYQVPVFGKSPQAYEGKEVSVSGYMIPVDAESTLFILSRYPYAACFFCGNAGPESVVELWIPEKYYKRYEMDQRMTFTGKLKLNNTDANHFIYILEGAREK
ncbi:MAG: DUF3299 domain-containing protein [Bacteroidota bacterium]